MSISVLDSKGFRAITGSNPSKNNYTTKHQRNQNIKGISIVSKSVISYLQDAGNVSVKDVDVFIEKVGLINGQFKKAELGTPFAADLVAMELLLGLREGLGSDYATLISDPFILELGSLSRTDKIEDQVAIAGKLYRFMGNVLIPSLHRASSRKEVLALEQCVDQCMGLYEKVKAVDTKGVLAKRHGEMIDVYNARFVKTGRLFGFLVRYKDGQLGNLNEEGTRSRVAGSLDDFVGDFINACKSRLVSNEERVRVYKAIVEIEAAFGKVGHREDVSPLVERLNAAFGIPDGMRSSFPIELAGIKGGSKKKLLQDLHVFQRDVLIPYLKGAASYSQLKGAMRLASDCEEVSRALASVDEKGVLKAQRALIEGIVDVKKVILNPVFLGILAADPKKVGDLKSEAYRGKSVKILTAVAKGVKEVEGHPLFTKELKTQFISGMKAMQREFDVAGHGKDLKPVMKLLGIPTREKKKVSSRFEKARARFNSSGTLVESSSTKSFRTGKVETLEHRKIRAFKKIQRLIAKLDPASLSFKSDVADILQEIAFVKRKYPSQTTRDFIFLERAMQILQRPSELLAVTSEEALVMRSIGAKHGVSKSAIGSYKAKTEARSIHEAQVNLIKGLRKKAKTLEELNSLAKSATHEIHAQTMRGRFEIFVAMYPLKPALGGHFAMHFPHIVRMLKNYSEKVALKEVVGLWGDIKELYDGSTAGQFSKVLATYSYMNPETHFPVILQEAQESFLTHIDFKAVGNAETIEFKSYMKKLVRAVGKVPDKIFEEYYKRYFTYRHRWLEANLPYIKIPYNQGDEKDTNLGRGVCMSNSLNRIGILAANPDAPIEALTMGSTPKTRKNQTKVKHYFFAAKNGEIPYSTAVSKELEQAIAFGIKLAKATPIVNPSSHIHQNLVNQMLVHAKTGRASFLVTLAHPKGGHAVNVHIDPKKNIYRLMDDNIGLLEYTDEATFRREVGKFISLVYGKYNVFHFYDFAKGTV